MNEVPKNVTGKPLRIQLAQRLGLPELHDAMHPRYYGTDCP
jgi:hypothetical protein